MSHELNQNQSNEQSQQSPRYSLKNFEKKDISEYPYPNKEIESLCTNFVCNLFNINPKSYESYGQNNFGVRKISENKIELKSENSPKKYSIESSPISIHKNQEKENLNNNNKNNNSSKSESNYDESDKENNSYLSNTPRNIKIVSNNVNNISNDNMKNICKDFIEDIFAQENEKYTKFNKYGDELNKIGLSEININNNININNINNNINNKNDFKITPEKVKYLMEHKKDIITIQKNWKTFYDVNRFKLLKYKTLIIQNFYRKYLIKKYNLPSNFYYNDKFLKMQTELYEETYKKNLNILFPSLFMDKSDLNEFASNMLEMANNPIHNPYDSGKIFLFAKILDFDMMIDTNECYETLWASIYDSIYTKCLQINDPIQLISLGSQHTICVTNKGKVYTFGWNNYGQCGVPINSTIVLKSELENNRLINVNKFNELDLKILNRIDGVKIPQIDEIILSNSITCGEDYTLIVDQEGKLWAFGLNLNGQLGLGHCEQIDKPSEVVIENNNSDNNNNKNSQKNLNMNSQNNINNSANKKNNNNNNIKKKLNLVKSAGYINFCTTEEGNIYMWPWGDKEGNVHYTPKKFYLSPLQEKEKVTSIACGNNFCLMLNNNGMVYSMGKSNKYGELGVGDFSPRYAPTPLQFFFLNKERINQISCGFKHSVAKSTTGRVYTWGCGCKGQLGQDNYNNMSIPGFVGFEDPFMKIIQVSAGLKRK